MKKWISNHVFKLFNILVTWRSNVVSHSVNICTHEFVCEISFMKKSWWKFIVKVWRNVRSAHVFCLYSMLYNPVSKSLLQCRTPTSHNPLNSPTDGIKAHFMFFFLNIVFQWFQKFHFNTLDNLIRCRDCEASVCRVGWTYGAQWLLHASIESTRTSPERIVGLNLMRFGQLGWRFIALPVKTTPRSRILVDRGLRVHEDRGPHFNTCQNASRSLPTDFSPPYQRQSAAHEGQGEFILRLTLFLRKWTLMAASSSKCLGYVHIWAV